MPTFPQQAIRTALHNALTASASVTSLVGTDIYVGQAAPTSAGDDLVLIESPSSTPRGDIKLDTGHELALRIRVSTVHKKGRVNPATADGIANAVHAAVLDLLGGMAPDGHHLLDVPEPDVTPQQYGVDDDARTAYDLLLEYTLLTQTTA